MTERQRSALVEPVSFSQPPPVPPGKGQTPVHGASKQQSSHRHHVSGALILADFPTFWYTSVELMKCANGSVRSVAECRGGGSFFEPSDSRAEKKRSFLALLDELEIRSDFSVDFCYSLQREEISIF